MNAQEFQGITVVVFRIAETDLSIGKHPLTQAPLLLTTTINLFIEPKTGTVVDQNALTTIIVDMGVQKVPVQIADVKWTDETIAEMVDLAKSSKTKLLWFETITP